MAITIMRHTPVRVECYAGFKADERPRRLQRGDRWIVVREIIDRWYQGDRDPEWPIADYFRVLGDDDRTYLLRHDRESDVWSTVGES